jgi:hypothetical protein
MYIIYVEPLPDIKPRMFALGFKRRPGDMGTPAVVPADAPGPPWKKPPNLMLYKYAARREPRAGIWREGGFCGRNAPCQLPLLLAP